MARRAVNLVILALPICLPRFGSERIVVAAITGTAENHTLHNGQTAAELGRHPAAHPRPLRSHVHRRRAPIPAGLCRLLAEHGADLDLALRIAIYRRGLPVTNLGNAARRQRLLQLQSHADPRQ
ncbi:hypothetical protein GCM10022255_094810 [Dactylosporangium darangshiense]|uniref:Uncharacterized protein n=1 Tax=Dactylosporangium darangshiense TaxID=579108 RepID=A0ABP8DQA2_9ACTN